MEKERTVKLWIFLDKEMGVGDRILVKPPPEGLILRNTTYYGLVLAKGSIAHLVSVEREDEEGTIYRVEDRFEAGKALYGYAVRLIKEALTVSETIPLELPLPLRLLMEWRVGKMRLGPASLALLLYRCWWLYAQKWGMLIWIGNERHIKNMTFPSYLSLMMTATASSLVLSPWKAVKDAMEGAYVVKRASRLVLPPLTDRDEVEEFQIAVNASYATSLDDWLHGWRSTMEEP